MTVRKARGLKMCIHCGEEKPLNCYNKHPYQVDGRDPRCKACLAIYQRSRARLCEYCRKENPDGGRWCGDDCQTAYRLRAAAQLKRPKFGMLIAEQSAPRCPECGSVKVWFGTDRLIGFTTIRCECGHEAKAPTYRGAA